VSLYTSIFVFRSSFIYLQVTGQDSIALSCRLDDESLELRSDYAFREPKPFECTITPRSVEAEKHIIALGETVSLDN
jgi:hypothetical protein